jgi:hypothetical protein
LDHDARPIDHGSYDRPIPLGSNIMTQVPLQYGVWVLQAAASSHAPTNNAVHNESTHSLQYPRYSAEQCNSQ